jgi:hypothetical protein
MYSMTIIFPSGVEKTYSELVQDGFISDNNNKTRFAIQNDGTRIEFCAAYNIVVFSKERSDIIRENHRKMQEQKSIELENESKN